MAPVGRSAAFPGLFLRGAQGGGETEAPLAFVNVVADDPPGLVAFSRGSIARKIAARGRSRAIDAPGLRRKLLKLEERADRCRRDGWSWHGARLSFELTGLLEEERGEVVFPGRMLRGKVA